MTINFRGQKLSSRAGVRTLIGATAIVVGLGAATLPAPLLAQTYSFNTVAIEGNKRIESGTILSYAGIARGQSVSAAELNDAYQRITASGLFESVEIEPRGSRLVIKVVEFPTVNRISFEGNKRIKDDDLSAVVQSQSRRVFSPSLAEQDAARITETYAQQGRLSARVQPRVIRRSDNRVDLVFEVFEGGVVEVERIDFSGNKAYSDSRLRRVLATKQAGLFRALIRSDTFISDRIEFDKQVLRDFYSSRGYVDFRITGVNAELAEERNGYFVNFNVEEGQQFKFGNITAVSDLPDVDTDVFQRAIKVRPGKVYSPSLVDNEIARLERLAIREGLNFVRVEPRVTRNDRDLTLDVELLLTKGPRVFVERIDIEGNTTTLDQVVRRQFGSVEGDPFNPREIRESAERIRALGFFADAQVEAREGSSPQQVVVDVNVEEKPTGSLSFGATYSSTTGTGITVEFSERNFLGRGQQLTLGVTTASESQNYKFNFYEPAFLGRDVGFGLALNYTETDNLSVGYDTATGTFSPSLSFPISDNGRLNLRYTADFKEMKNPSDVGDITAAEVAVGKVWQQSLGYSFSYDTRRTGLDPNSGVLLEFGQDFGIDDNDENFLITSVRAIAQTKILSEEVTLRATLEGGALDYSGGGGRAIDRFMLGPSKLRGFDYAGIGPREIGTTTGGTAYNDALGGNYFAVARFEAEFPLPVPEEYGISGGVFYDVGSLWGLDNTTTSTGTVYYQDFTPRHVIGASVFWNTAIGPLRFNWTKALTKERFDQEQTFDLTISTKF